jgi:hypothetical protein
MAEPETFKGFKVVRSYQDEPEPAESDILSKFKYVRDIPTVGGVARESAKAIGLGAVTSGVSSPLRGFAGADAAIEQIRDERLREQLQAQIERATKGERPEDAMMAAREIRRLGNLYLPRDERDALTALANEIEQGPQEREEAAKKIDEAAPFTGPYKPLAERLPYRMGEAVEKKAESLLGRRKGYEEGAIGFGLDVAQGVGSIGGIVGASLLGGYTGVIAAASFQGIDEQLQRAQKAGLKEDEALDYALAGAGPGAIGVLSAEFMLRKIPVPIRSRMLKIAGEWAGAGAGEAMVEATQQMLQNAIEMEYNKDRGLFDGTIYAGAVGGTAGLALKPIFMALARRKGAGVPRTTESDSQAGDVDAIRRAFAAEEVRLRAERERLGGEAGADGARGGEGEAQGRTPAAAAARGEIKQDGTPVSVRLAGTEGTPGELITGTAQSAKPDADGTIEFFDREGTKWVLERGEYDSVTEGWVTGKPDAELEADLSEWLQAESPWQKVTVTTPDGEVIKGVASGELDGKQFVRGPDGQLLPRDTGTITEGWDSSIETPAPAFTGKRAEAQKTVQPLTESDKASPIPDDLIRDGKATLADAIGSNEANAALQAMGLPKVGEQIGIRLLDDSVAKVTIQDANESTVQYITNDGEVRVVQYGQLQRKLVPILDEGATDVQEAGRQGTEQVQERRERPEADGDGRTAAQDGAQGRARAGDEGVRPQDVGTLPSRGGIITPLEPRLEAGQPPPEPAPTPTPEAPAPTPEATPAETGTAPQARAPQPEPPPEQPEAAAAVDAPVALTPETEASTRAWWDSATPEQRRQAVVDAGYSERISPTRSIPDTAGRAIIAADWDALQPAARTGIARVSRPAVESYTREQRAAATVVTPTAPAAPPRATVTTARGTTVPVEYKVVEADSLVTSQDTAGRTNPAYPQELQPRDRARAASLDQINRIAADIRPEFLAESPKASDGAPIIGPDNVVESGNARSIALQKAYDEGKAEGYKAFLAAQGYPVQDMAKPVLVRVRQGEMTPAERAAFTKEANVSDTLEMSPTEQALSDAALLPDDMLSLYRGGRPEAQQNRPMVRAFMRDVLSQTESGKFLTSDGNVSEGGAKRLRNALLARAFGDATLIEAITESTDSNIKAIGAALEQVAPQWALMRAAAARGDIDPGMDQTANLLAAVNIVRRSRTDGRDVAEYVGQIDMFSRAIPEAFLKLMFRDTQQYTKPVGTDKLAEALNFYVQEGMKTRAGTNLLGEMSPAQTDIIDLAKKRQYQDETKQQQLFGRKSEPKPEAAAPASEPARGPEPRAEEPSKPGTRLKKSPAKDSGRGETAAVGAEPATPAKKRLTAKPKPEPAKAESKHAKKALKPKPKPETKAAEPAPAPKQEGLIYKKDGKPYATAEDAMRIRSDETHEAVQVDGGWAVRRKDDGIKAQRITAEQLIAHSTDPSPDPLQDKTNREIRAYFDSLGLHDVLGFSQPMVAMPDGTWVQGLFVPETTATELYNLRQGFVALSLDASPDYAATLRHEAIHALRNMGLFYDGEWAALSAAAQADAALMAETRKNYPSLTKEGQIEEAVAEMFAAHESGSKVQKGFIGRLLDKIKTFFQDLGATFRKAGYKDAKSVMDAIARGKIGGRPRGQTRGGEAKAAVAPIIQAATNQLNTPNAGLVSNNMRMRLGPNDIGWANDIGAVGKVAYTPRLIASLYEAAAPVYVTTKHQYALRDSIASRLGRDYKPYRQLKRASRLNVDKVLEMGMLEDSVYRPAANGTITVTASKEGGLMKRGETITLTEAETEAYQSVRQMMQNALEIYRDSTVLRFGFDPLTVKTARDALGLITPQTPPSQRAKINLLAKLLTDLKQSERTGYIPLSRHGNMVILAQEMNPTTGQYETVHSETMEAHGPFVKERKSGAIRKRMAELQAKYPNADVRSFQIADKNDPRSNQDKDLLVELLQTPPQDLVQKLQDLEKETLKRGFRKHFFRAKKIPGYSLDLERSIADYVIGLAGNVSRSAYHKQWENVVNAIPKNQSKLRAWADKYRNYITEGSEEYSVLRQAGFVTFLAGNFSNAALNLTQVPLITAPYMSMFSNSISVWSNLIGAAKDTGKMIRPGTAKMEIFDPAAAPLDVRADLQKAWDAGEFTPLAMFDIMGVANSRATNLRGFSAGTRKAIDYVAIPQTMTERANRVATYIAAHRQSRKGGAAFEAKVKEILKGNALARETLLKNYSHDAYARWIVDETHYDLGKMNRPEFMRGVGAPLTQFKSFVVNTLETHRKIATMYGRPGVKAFAMMMLGLFLSAGTYGFPGGDDGMWLVELAYKWWTGLDADIRTWTRELYTEITGSPQLANYLTNGFTRAAGIDMTNRIGMGRIIPRTTEEAGGVPLSLVTDKAWGAVTHIKDGRPVDAAIEAMPLFMKNPAEAVKWGTQGVRTRYGDPVLVADEVTASAMAAKVFGFTPGYISDARAMEWAQQRASAAPSELRDKFYKRSARAIAEQAKATERNDVDAALKWGAQFADIMEDLQKHNEKMIREEKYHLIIRLDRTTMKKKVAAEFVGRGAIRDRSAPKASRLRRREIEEIYQPSE